MAHVLVVDDDEATRDLLHFLLVDAGYAVDETATVPDAVAFLLAASGPLVVLFDWVMPGLSGADLVRIADRDVPFIERHAFICLTASPKRLPDEFTVWLSQHHAPIVAKPFDVDALLAVVACEAARLPAHS